MVFVLCLLLFVILFFLLLYRLFLAPQGLLLVLKVHYRAQLYGYIFDILGLFLLKQLGPCCKICTGFFDYILLISSRSGIWHHDTLGNCDNCSKVVHGVEHAGGGAPEIEVSRQLGIWSKSLHGMESFCVRAFADALEVSFCFPECAGSILSHQGSLLYIMKRW